MTAAAPLPTAPADATPGPGPAEKRAIEILLPRGDGAGRRRLTLRLPADWEEMSIADALAVGAAVIAALCPSADAAAVTAALRVGEPVDGPVDASGGVR